MAALILAAVLLVGGRAHAARFVVDTLGHAPDATTQDGLCLAIGGGCTYEAALAQAEAKSDLDTIEFAFAGVPPFVITAGPEGFPSVQNPVEIRCDTQVGYVPCDDALCANGVWPVVFDRQGGVNGGLWFNAPGTQIVGCAIRNVGGSNTAGYGIHFNGAPMTARGCHVEQCWGGIVTLGGVIGGPSLSDMNVVEHNHFGLTVFNGGWVLRNVTRFNASNGVYVEGGADNVVDGVVTYGNAGPGIFVKQGCRDTVIRNSTIGAPVCNAEGIQDQGVNTDASRGNTTAGCEPPEPDPWCGEVTGLGAITCIDQGLIRKYLSSEAEFVTEVGSDAIAIPGSYRAGGRCENPTGPPHEGGHCVALSVPPSASPTPTPTPSGGRSETPAVASATPGSTRTPQATVTFTSTGTELPTPTPTRPQLQRGSGSAARPPKAPLPGLLRTPR